MNFKKTEGLMLATMMGAGVLLSLAAPPAYAAGTSYYVSAAGSDTNTGTSAAAPWKTLAKVNRSPFSPGDTISFRRGDTWTGGLVLNPSGTSGSPITVNGYGTGSAPAVTGGTSGNCFRVNGSYVTLDGLRGSACGYAGFSIYGAYVSVRNSSASNNAVGMKSSTGSSFGSYTNNVLTDNNIMNINTPGTNCGTPQAVNCGDDSGAFGILLNGNDNDVSGSTVSGSNAFSYDFGRDGSAVEIYNGNRNKIHDNISLQNNDFSEIGRSGSGTADGNTYSYNMARSDCGANCSQSNLHLTGTSPAIDRAGVSPFTADLDGVPVPQNGDCTGASLSDSGAYEYDSPNC